MNRGRGIHGTHRAAVLGLLVVALLLPAKAGAYEHRRGTPSAGGRFQYGITAGDSDWHEIFDHGWGGAINVRQYIARDRAVGITAEQQSFDSKTGDPVHTDLDPSYASFDKIQFQILMLDYYVYFNRMAKRTPYLLFSGGFYRPQLIDDFQELGSGTSGEQVQFPKEGFVLRGGVGLEYFLQRSVSIDSNLSTYLISAPGVDGTMLTVQFGFGIHLYTR